MQGKAGALHASTGCWCVIIEPDSQPAEFATAALFVLQGIMERLIKHDLSGVLAREDEARRLALILQGSLRRQRRISLRSSWVTSLMRHDSIELSTLSNVV